MSFNHFIVSPYENVVCILYSLTESRAIQKMNIKYIVCYMEVVHVYIVYIVHLRNNKERRKTIHG